jgi:hypothetical protein
MNAVAREGSGSFIGKSGGLLKLADDRGTTCAEG